MKANSTQKPNLTKAVIQVMKAVKGIEKNSIVGSGNYQYQGVSDADVKKAYNNAMSENGLCILPIDIEADVQIDRWQEGNRQKQQVFTEVKTTYLLMHESGESQEIVGYGHGTDSNDKAAGKATTYAMKYALLYTFLTPTGAIDDTDTQHSDDADKPSTEASTIKPRRNANGDLSNPAKPWLNTVDPQGKTTREWNNILKGIQAGTIQSVRDVRDHYKVNKATEAEIKEQLQHSKTAA